MSNPSKPLDELEKLLNDDSVWEEDTAVTNIINIETPPLPAKKSPTLKTIITTVALIVAALLEVARQLGMQKP